MVRRAIEPTYSQSTSMNRKVTLTPRGDNESGALHLLSLLFIVLVLFGGVYLMQSFTKLTDLELRVADLERRVQRLER